MTRSPKPRKPRKPLAIVRELERENFNIERFVGAVSTHPQMRALLRELRRSLKNKEDSRG